MKKFFTLIAALAATLSMSAQSLSFVDDQGVLADGATKVMDFAQDNGWGEIQVPLMDISLQNNTEDDITPTFTATIDELTSGSFQCCLGSSCKALTKAGSIVINNVSIAGGESQPIQYTEWVPDTYGTQLVKFTASTGSETTTLYVNFIYADPAGINEVNDNAKANANIYNLAGQRVQKMQKGINIVNGRKYLVK